MALRWNPLFDGPVGGLGSANKFRAIEAVRSDFYAGELEVSELKEEDMPVGLMVKFRVT